MSGRAVSFMTLRSGDKLTKMRFLIDSFVPQAAGENNTNSTFDASGTDGRASRPFIKINDAEYAIATIGARGRRCTMEPLPMEGRWAPLNKNGFFLSYGQGDERGGGGARHCTSAFGRALLRDRLWP